MKRKRSITRALHRGASRAFVLGPLTFLLVAGAGCPSLFESTDHRAAKLKQAEPGRDSAKTVTSTTGEIVNGYAALAANVAASATTVTYSNADAIFGTLAKGDLLLIIQMQGVTIDTSNTVAYGSIAAESDLGNTGYHEFVGVEAVATATSTITLACGLKHAYITGGATAAKTQLVRVPQYTTLTINTGASVIAKAWDGTSGGIVAVQAATVQLAGTIDASAKGFRGGPAHDSTGNTGAASPYAANTAASGAEKGESIAGYTTGYGTGRYGRGAPANGGGGGDPHNGGGGGGANAGLVAGWTSGLGVAAGWTDTTGWHACSDTNLPASAGGWAVEPGFTSCAAWAQEGGGRGGYSWSDSNQNALTVAPGNTAWAGDNRRVTGGLGGRPLASSPATRLYMGGGGGAGDGNDGRAGRGGIGGGMVFVIASSVAGSGSVLANGEAGVNDGTGGTGDAGGGGGGGGTIVVYAGSIASTVKVRANGGTGGQNSSSAGQNEVEGPGGGGGGGYIAVSGGTTDLQANGGPGGITTRTGLSEFQENGATAGHAGITNGSVSGMAFCGALATTIATKPANPTSDTTGDFTFTNTDIEVTYECKLDANDWAACTASYTTPALLDGSHTLTVRATDSYGNQEPQAGWPTYTWVVDTVAPNTSIVSSPDDPSADPTGDFTFGATETGVTYECMLDTGSWVSCTTNYTTPPLTDGEHTLSVRATDAAGNRDATPATYTWDVAAPLPITTIASYPTNPSNDTTGDFAFTNTKSPVTYECKLDTGDWASCGAGYTTPELTDGSHTLSVRATDENAVVEDPPVTFTWLVDTVPPDTSIVDKPANPSSSAVGDFTFQSTENPATFECSLDGAAFATCPASYQTPSLGNGPHTLDVRAKDAAGNVDATPATYAWTINAAGVDGGTIDGGEAEAGGNDDTGPVGTVDAEAIDGEATEAGARDTQQPGRDTLPVLDVGNPAEVRADQAGAGDAAPDGAAADALRDTQTAGAEPGPETTPVGGPEPAPDTAPAEPDTAPPVTQDDAAVSVTEDAAPPPITTEIKIRGGGFCAISPARTASPAGLALLGLAGLALLRRRRR
jgi:MYXO-CTERM domain-containing protein